MVVVAIGATARAEVEMRTMVGLPNWYPQHFLDTAEGALGMATGLDWLHDSLTPDEREQFATALVQKALKPGLLVAAEKTWVSGNNNWTAVCHGGLVVAALAIAEREPALAKQIVDRALKHMPRYAELYAPVGAYSEGPDYWAYGTTFYALLVESLRTALGTTAGLEHAPGFLKTADYTLQMTAPSGVLFNFGDNGSGLGFEPILFWFARELRRGDLVQRELANLEKLADAIATGAPRGDASRMLSLALLWRVPSLVAAPAFLPPLAWWSEGGSQPQAVLRSKWHDPRSTFVGLKAGQADDSHAHMDIGSFILEADGVRWAVDLGRESYPHARRHDRPPPRLRHPGCDRKMNKLAMMFPLPARSFRPIFALLLFAIGFPYSAARTWHVSGSGNDTHVGTSAAAAFRSLQKAAGLVEPGDTVTIGDGVYSTPTNDANGNVLTISRSGRPEAWITWQAAPNAHPELRPTGWGGIVITGSYHVIDGLTVIGGNDSLTLPDALADAKKPRPGAHDLIADPRFIDVQSDLRRADFRLAPGSPGLDAGTDDLAQPTDRLGRPRPAGARRDRGAYEQ